MVVRIKGGNDCERRAPSALRQGGLRTSDPSPSCAPKRAVCDGISQSLTSLLTQDLPSVAGPAPSRSHTQLFLNCRPLARTSLGPCTTARRRHLPTSSSLRGLSRPAAPPPSAAALDNPGALLSPVVVGIPSFCAALTEDGRLGLQVAQSSGIQPDIKVLGAECTAAC